MEANDFEGFRSCLGDFDFVQAKCMAGLGYDMMAECTLGYHYALETNTTEKTRKDLGDILQFLRSEVHILAKNPILTLQQAANYPQSSWVGRAADGALRDWEQSVSKVLPQPQGWVKWINKPNVPEAFLFELDGHSKGVLSTCFSRDDRYYFILTLKAREEGRTGGRKEGKEEEGFGGSKEGREGGREKR